MNVRHYQTMLIKANIKSLSGFSTPTCPSYQAEIRVEEPDKNQLFSLRTIQGFESDCMRKWTSWEFLLSCNFKRVLALTFQDFRN